MNGKLREWFNLAGIALILIPAIHFMGFGYTFSFVLGIIFFIETHV